MQGTVADIVNVACLRLLDCASVVLPLHDAIYAVVPKEKVQMIESAIIGRAQEIGLVLRVEQTVYSD